LTYPPTTVKNGLAAQSLGYAGLSTSQDRQLWPEVSQNGGIVFAQGPLLLQDMTAIERDIMLRYLRLAYPGVCGPHAFLRIVNHNFGLQRRSKTVNRHTDHFPRQSGLDYAPWERWPHGIALRVSFHQQRVRRGRF
jgi:hypothetical protein